MFNRFIKYWMLKHFIYLELYLGQMFLYGLEKRLWVPLVLTKNPFWVETKTFVCIFLNANELLLPSSFTEHGAFTAYA